MNSGFSASAAGGWKSAGNKTRSDVASEEEGRPSSRANRQPSPVKPSAPAPAFIPPTPSAASPSTYRRASIYPSSPSYSDLENPTAPPMFDPRETNSTRDNITQLVNKNRSASPGQNRSPSGENQPRGLAGLMGGAGRAPRLHRANTGPTQDEREITERLEREMEISKAKWSGKIDGDATKAVGLSMASLMQGRAPNAVSPGGAPEKQRWAVRGTPAKVDPPPSTLASPRNVPTAIVSPSITPSPLSPAITTKTATVFTRAPPPSATVPFPSSARSVSPALASLSIKTTPAALTTTTTTTAKSASIPFPSTPLSLATALGSTSTGPRLNKPTPSPSFASPAQSFPFPSPSSVASQPAPVALPGLVRTSSVRERARSLATLGGQEWAPKEVVEARKYPGQTEGIVADRLKLAESPRGSPRVSGASAGSDVAVAIAAGESPTKKGRSVLERWNRDEADQKGATSPSPTKKFEGRWNGGSQSVDIRDSSTMKTFNRPTTVNSPSPLPSIHSPAMTPSLSPSTSKTQLFPLHSSSAQGSPKLSAGPSPPRGMRGDPSPRFDSPPMDDSAWGELGGNSASSTSPVHLKTSANCSTVGGGRVAPGRGWTAPPIGVKEYKKPGIFSSASNDALGLGIEEEKVALPGMIVPSKRPSTPTSIPLDEDTPRPWSPSKRPTTTHSNSYTPSSPAIIPSSTRSAREVVNSFNQRNELERSISAAKLDEILAGSPPRSSVKNAIATWGTPSRSTSGNSISASAANNIVLGVTYPTPKRMRTVSQDTPMVAKPDSTPRGKKDDGKSIKLLSLASDGVTSLPLDDDRSLLYETESVLLLDPKTNRAFLWTGRESSLESEKLQTRIAELTSGEVVRCVQGMESREFVELLGGRLVVRQGSREQYDVNDSRLYRVAYEQSGLLFIQEDNLSIDSLCSKNCAVVTLLGEVNIWIGRGSTALEQRATLDFAKSVSGDRRITSYEEGKEGADFWSILDGDREEYANAHHWLYRPTSFTPYSLPTLYTLDSSAHATLNPTSTLSRKSLHVLRTEMEWLLLVPGSLKEENDRIEGGIKAMQALIKKDAKGKKVEGVLVFPSALPRDVRFASRGLDSRMRELNEDLDAPKGLNFWSVEDYREEFLSGN